MTVNNKLYGQGFYLLEEDNLITLGINGTIHRYIVNYDTGEVVTLDPFIVADKPIYTKNDLIIEETDNSVAGNAEYDEAKGVNKPVLYTGMIPVKNVDGRWVVTSVDDVEWYDYAVNNNGPVRYANVMLLDDITLIDDDDVRYSNEKIRSMNISSLVGFKVVKEGSMFVWIPRYTYKGDEIVYSKLTKDYVQNGFLRAPAFYNGDYTGATVENDNAGYVAGGKELTGIWISKYEASYAN